MLKRILHLLLATSGTLCVLCAGAWLGGAFSGAEARVARPPRATDGLATYPDRGLGPTAGEVPVGDALSVNGQPMQLSLFFTSDPPDQVIAWYSDALTKKGLIPIAHSEDQVGHVSVFDPDDGLQRFVTALPQGDGQTLVLVGLTNPRKPPHLLTGAKTAPFPVPEQQRGYLSYASDDAGQRAQNAQFVTTLSAPAVLAFYRKELAAGGYTELTADATPAMTLFRKGAVSLSVAVQALDEKGGAAVFVSRLEGAQQ